MLLVSRWLSGLRAGQQDVWLVTRISQKVGQAAFGYLSAGLRSPLLRPTLHVRGTTCTRRTEAATLARSLHGRVHEKQAPEEAAPSACKKSGALGRGMARQKGQMLASEGGVRHADQAVRQARPFAFRRDGEALRTIASPEAFGVLLALLAFRPVPEENHYHLTVQLPVFFKRSGRQMTIKLLVWVFVMELSAPLEARRVRMDVRRVQRESNHEADDLLPWLVLLGGTENGGRGQKGGYSDHEGLTSNEQEGNRARARDDVATLLELFWRRLSNARRKSHRESRPRDAGGAV